MRELQGRFHRAIPGGAHTYAKGDDQYPEPPFYIVEGNGCRVRDTEGREYIEYAMGLRAVTLGHAFPPVVEAAIRQMQFGANFNRPTLMELECAERLLSLIDGSEMVKFAKNGSDAVDGAVRLARAYTGRDLLAVCGDHPFFSGGDWFIGSTPMAAGIPGAIKGLALKFHYNDVAGLRALFQTYPCQIAAVILEPEKDIPPAPDFLAAIRELCDQEGAILIFDEMITGFRWHNGGAQNFYSIRPDLSTFGKALGNGFAIAALVGRRDIMEQGGILQKEKPRVFLLSTTHGAESHSLAAALAVMEVYRREPVIETLWARGRRLQDGIDRAIEELQLRGYFHVAGKPCCLTYRTCDESLEPSQGFRTLFLQETLKRGVLAPSLVVSYSHTERDIDQTIDAIYESLVVYRKALDDGLPNYLEGRPVKPVFREFN